MVLLVVGLGRGTQFFVEVGVDEPGVAVVLHQAVDPPLCRQEAALAGLAEALRDGVLGAEIQIDL